MVVVTKKVENLLSLILRPRRAVCDYLSALSDRPQSEEAGGSSFVPMLDLIIVIIIGFHGCDGIEREGKNKFFL